MLGIEDIIIVDTEDELLICSKDKAQNVNEVLQKLKKEESGVFMIYFLRNISKYFCYLYCFLGKGGTVL
ncbi:hypothetical protein PGH24_07580 [Thermoanaerobacterium thermosaccharolyticum]|nr:hypothetical protein PGH24_07580 [Thermoanaerobacterium thermosaccharolyticum]